MEELFSCLERFCINKYQLAFYLGYIELSNKYTIDRRRKLDGEIFLASYTLKFSQKSKQCKIELQRIYLA